MSAGQNGGQRNRQGRDMSQRVEIRRACAVAHPQPFLTCGFETRIVTLTLRPQGVSPFKVETAAVNGKPVIVWNGLVFRAAPVFLPVVPVFVVAGANTGFGLAEGAAVFLPNPPSAIGGLAILVHGQPGLADWVTGRNRFRGFCAAWIEGDKSFPIIDRFHGVVDAFHVIALVGKKGAFFQRNRLIRGREDLRGNGRIRDIARRGQLVERQSRDAVHQHMACKQCHILNDFLSVDSGQPLSGWFSLQANFTKKGLRFLYHLSEFRFQPWPGTIAITAFLAFCS